MVAGEPQPRDAPPRDVAKPDGAAGGKDPGQRCAARVRRPENASHAGAGDVRNRNAMLLEDLEHSQVRETACKSAAERQADTRAGSSVPRRVVQKAVHAKSFPRPLAR